MNGNTSTLNLILQTKTSRHQAFKQLSLEKSWFNCPTFLLNNDFDLNNDLNIGTENEKLSV